MAANEAQNAESKVEVVAEIIVALTYAVEDRFFAGLIVREGETMLDEVAVVLMDVMVDIFTAGDVKGKAKATVAELAVVLMYAAPEKAEDVGSVDETVLSKIAVVLMDAIVDTMIGEAVVRRDEVMLAEVAVTFVDAAADRFEAGIVVRESAVLVVAELLEGTSTETHISLKQCLFHIVGPAAPNVRRPMSTKLAA